MIREIKIKYPQSLNSETHLSIMGSLSEFHWSNIEGLGLPEVRNDISIAGNRDGGLMGENYYGLRIISVEGYFHGHSKSDLIDAREKLSYALSLGNREEREVVLIVDEDDGSTKTLFCNALVNKQPDMAVKAGQRQFGAFRFELVCSSPFFFGGETIGELGAGGYIQMFSEEVLPYAGGGGQIPATIPFSFTAGSAEATTITTTSSGTVTTKITIHANIENPSMVNETTGESFSVNGVFTDNIIIENGTVKTATGNNILSSFTGDFITLQEGENVLKLTGINPSAGSKAVVEWFDTFITT